MAICSLLGKETGKSSSSFIIATTAGWNSSDCTSGKEYKEEKQPCVHLGWFHLLHPESKCWPRQDLYPAGISLPFLCLLCAVSWTEKTNLFFPAFWASLALSLNTNNNQDCSGTEELPLPNLFFCLLVFQMELLKIIFDFPVVTFWWIWRRFAHILSRATQEKVSHKSCGLSLQSWLNDFSFLWIPSYSNNSSYNLFKYIWKRKYYLSHIHS